MGNRMGHLNHVPHRVRLLGVRGRSCGLPDLLGRTGRSWLDSWPGTDLLP